MSHQNQRTVLRKRRKRRIRRHLSGTTDRPRLSIFRSAKHIFAQVVDDGEAKTLVSVGSFKAGGRANKERCQSLGKELAAKCKEKNISKVAFDRNGFAYHGRIQAFADGAREGGLEF